MLRVFCNFCLVIILLFWSNAAQAGQLSQRLAQFSHWESKPPVSAASGDLIYPNWIEGTWNVTSTLVDLAAPLAPDVVTPGFESNRQYLNQPVSFTVSFVKASSTTQTGIILPLQTSTQVIADRAFNGLNIGRAYLGDRAIQSVKVDPNSPNRQITLLKGDRQLISIVTGRNSESPNSDQFVATEVSQQIFGSKPQLYFNTVETTTAYTLIQSKTPKIEADQVTAVYLSPQDPDYFKAIDKPVALYRYRLQLLPLE
ncbi:hypothetical protein Cri9333_1571 [Crinalium epipsammum PCC 9333]|uniref:DUF6816 domain-containing protein n=1 Tax=Crinalium epipsammum PCC 9333 TaxID=1173022 RepID=K9VWU3_9CYAN|nr:hypothetical protein [Crinalium epipsammum]AFZ12461.1 hypothetical protein Cri9333_1571 [Crinalium epipsammum PCC 9333]